MGSVLGSFGAFQDNIWSVAPFIPVGPSKNGLKKHEKSDFSKNARPIFLVFSHNPSILGMKEIPKFSRSVTYTLGWIWSGEVLFYWKKNFPLLLFRYKRATKDRHINCSDNICQLQTKYWQHVIVFPGTFKELLFSNIRLFLMSNDVSERRRTLCIFYEQI